MNCFVKFFYACSIKNRNGSRKEVQGICDEPCRSFKPGRVAICLNSEGGEVIMQPPTNRDIEMFVGGVIYSALLTSCSFW